MNALEVLEARFANRETIADSKSRLTEARAGRNNVRFADEFFRPPKYHTTEWWQDEWEAHLAWQERVYPPAAVTGWEVTPVTGKVPQ